MKYNLLDRKARKIIELNVPSIENFANREQVLLGKSFLCEESNEEFNNYFKLTEYNIKPEITRKT